MNKVRIISVPYDRGPRGSGSGAGPLYLLEHGIVENLTNSNPDISFDQVEVSAAEDPTDDWEGVLKVNKHLKRLVLSAIAEHRFPLILGGCLTSMGIVAALGSTGDLRVIWLDAHGDLNTPDTSASGMVEGMSLALITGLFGQRTWRQLTDAHTVAHENVALVGGWDLDSAELEVLENTAISVVSVDDVREGLENGQNPENLFQFRIGIDHPIYIHLDVDVIDSQSTPELMMPNSNGLSIDEVSHISGILSDSGIAAMSINAKNPQNSATATTAQSIITIVNSVLKQIFA